jgi:hypothetical protein
MYHVYQVQEVGGFKRAANAHLYRVGQNHIYTVFLAGISPNIRSHTVYIFGPGQPYTCMMICTGTQVEYKAHDNRKCCAAGSDGRGAEAGRATKF